MSAVNTIPANIFNTEFLNSPAATAAAWISIIGAVALSIKLIGTVFRYKQHHNEILKKSGVPAFILNIFFITIPLRKLPGTDWSDKIITIAFSLAFLFSASYFTPTLIQTAKTQPDQTLLFWKKSGDPFYISKKMASAVTISAHPTWTLSVGDCSQSATTNIEKYNSLTIEHKEYLCKLLTTKEGQTFLDKSINKFRKDKLFIYSIIPITLLALLWLPLSFIFTIYYSGKVRKYILTEQEKAIHCVHGEFKKKGIYEIYQELDRKTLC
ncbi:MULTISPECIES: DUF6216 family protein [Enterobacterales]|uniref:DUF6216 family protein n=1 Tax=Enterobacterales TaxID=91347 RepID=UPI002EDBA004